MSKLKVNVEDLVTILLRLPRTDNDLGVVTIKTEAKSSYSDSDMQKLLTKLKKSNVDTIIEAFSSENLNSKNYWHRYCKPNVTGI